MKILHRCSGIQQASNVRHLVFNRRVPQKLIKLIKNLYRINIIQAKSNEELADPISVENGLKQGDSYSLLLVKKIRQLRKIKDYKLEDGSIASIFYADEAVLKTKKISKDTQVPLQCKTL